MAFLGGDFEALTHDPYGKPYFIFTNGCSKLSNYHFTPFTIDGVEYFSMEQYIHAHKALHAGDRDAYDRIMVERRAREYCRIPIRGLNYATWDASRRNLVLKGLKAKFAQNDPARRKLETTGSATIVCAGSHNGIDGTKLVGLEAFDETKWRGRNELGKLLMEVRDGA